VGGDNAEATEPSASGGVVSAETANGLWALALVLGGFAVACGVGIAVAYALLDERGYVKRWRR
jgi:hypothetical protein